jgi:hypothetical protein
MFLYGLMVTILLAMLVGAMAELIARAVTGLFDYEDVIRDAE